MTENTSAIIKALADIIQRLASGELVARDAEIGTESPSVVEFRPLGYPATYRKVGPTVTTLSLRMVHKEKK